MILQSGDRGHLLARYLPDRQHGLGDRARESVASRREGELIGSCDYLTPALDAPTTSQRPEGVSDDREILTRQH
jgi:hypothetical protein